VYYGYVQQSGMYETLDLVITDVFTEKYSDYYKNPDQWYLAIKSDDFKEVVEMMWFAFIDHGEPDMIKVHTEVHIEDNYNIDKHTIKVMFAERILQQYK
jgi:uncharacterized protein involved in tellurium resistance